MFWLMETYDARAYRTLMQRLGLTHEQAGRLFGVSGRTSKNWGRYGFATAPMRDFAMLLSAHLDGTPLAPLVKHLIAEARQDEPAKPDAKSHALSAPLAAPVGSGPKERGRKKGERGQRMSRGMKALIAEFENDLDDATKKIDTIRHRLREIEDQDIDLDDDRRDDARETA
jgi:hypothetical protein